MNKILDKMFENLSLTILVIFTVISLLMAWVFIAFTLSLVP